MIALPSAWVAVAALVPVMLAAVAAADEPVNLATGARASASSSLAGAEPAKAIDGRIDDDSRWVSARDAAPPAWLQVDLRSRMKLGGVHVHSGWKDGNALGDFHVEYRDGEKWRRIPSAEIRGNDSQAVAIPFDDTIVIETDALRLVVDHRPGDLARVRELLIWPASAEGIPRLRRTKDTATIPPIYLNQSGFNRSKPKRFTAPYAPDGTPFTITPKNGADVVFEGVITGRIGDFTSFAPEGHGEYVVTVGDDASVPFRIGRFWLERVTYRGSVDFMVDARHYGGTYTEPCPGSFGWRDDHQFSFELNGLVAQYLANPSAYDRMDRTLPPLPAGDGARWGVLEPCDSEAPDIIRLIHWGADVIVTQRLEHMLLKEQLAFFLHAWPLLQRWLPRQNYDTVLAYARDVWTKPTIDRAYPYDTIREDHDLLKVKTEIGTTKGESPPGHSILPNLLMHEVAIREHDQDPGRYFRAAHDQAAWLIKHVDWNDPLTTKGQRMSEHVVMSGLGMLLRHHADRAPAGLQEKLRDWATVAVGRSDNLWDFRKLSAEQWTPTGTQVTHWNEAGNVMGFAACALAVLPAIDDEALRGRLEQIIWSHIDNCFGRNPCGRHFSYDAPREIEGVEFGWYSFHHGGIGQLEKARFVFDGAPKNGHYPYHPEVGNIGWTEGWVAFNSAFNASLAALALHDTRLVCELRGRGMLVRLRAPLDFDERSREKATVTVLRHGKPESLEVVEESDDTEWLSATLADAAGVTQIFYGHGLWRTSCDVPVDR
jgi:hypothetical protein